MNNNSSRFGKYLELLFSRDGAILGGCFKEYLLEKCRVTVQGASERNFHIFYQMFAGLSDEQKEMLCLDKPTNHRYVGFTVVADLDFTEIRCSPDDSYAKSSSSSYTVPNKWLDI